MYVNEPLVSVIVPTYNRAGLICRSITSILEQDYPAVEIIVVDDGSTDRTEDVISRFGEQVRYVCQDHAGPAAARNHGIHLSHGQFLAFLDSDDTWHHDKLTRQMNLLLRYNDTVPCCLCNSELKGYRGVDTTSFQVARLNPPQKEGLWKNVLDVLLDRFVLFNQAVLIRSHVLENMNAFNESLWVMEDHDLALRLADYGPWAYITEPLVTWNQGSPGSLYSISQQKPVQLQSANRTIYVDLLKRLRPDDQVRCRKAKQLLRKAKVSLWVACLQEHRFTLARAAGKILRAAFTFAERLHRRLTAPVTMVVNDGVEWHYE